MRKLFLGILLCFIFSCSYAQTEKYGFAQWDNRFVQQADEPFYYVVSDPVRNFDQFDFKKRDQFQIDFKVNANKQVGFVLVGSKGTKVPNSPIDVNPYSSKSACEEGIQKHIAAFKEQFSGKNQRNYNGKPIPVKIIYVNLYLN